MKNGLTVDKYGKYWYKNDLLHREDGPAIEFFNEDKYYYLNNKLHRENGPAIESADGNKWYYLNGEYIKVSSYEEFKRIVKLKYLL